MYSLHSNGIIKCHCSGVTLRSQNLHVTTDCFLNLSFFISPPLPPTAGHFKDQFILIRSHHQFFSHPGDQSFPGPDQAKPKRLVHNCTFCRNSNPTNLFKEASPCAAFLLPNHTSSALLRILQNWEPAWQVHFGLLLPTGKDSSLLVLATVQLFPPLSPWATCSSFPTLPVSLLTTHQAETMIFYEHVLDQVLHPGNLLHLWSAHKLLLTDLVTWVVSHFSINFYKNQRTSAFSKKPDAMDCSHQCNPRFLTGVHGDGSFSF